MGKLIDISGQTFGKLTVISNTGKYNSDQRLLWNCLCDCGNKVLRTMKSLKRKNAELYCGNSHPTKVCTVCKQEKNRSSDYHKLNCPQGIQPTCKECTAKFYQDNKEKIVADYHKNRQNPDVKERMRKIRYASWQRNKHKELPYKREYNKRPEVVERRKKIHHDRKSIDLQYNIKRRLRWRLRDALKRNLRGCIKRKSSLVLLGCDIDFFKSYIEERFQVGMNWGRFAYIHLDHIKPCNEFDLTQIEQQKLCFHYTNIQPLWEVDNLRKSYKY